MNLFESISKLFTKRYHPSQEPPIWWNDMWAGSGNSGVDVTPERAMQSMTVFACVHILAETVAAMPLHVYRRLKGGGKERATDSEIYPVLHLKPNPEMTSFELRETLMGHLGIRGNAYCEIQRNQAGQVIGLWPLRPDKIQLLRTVNGLVYHYTMPDRIGGYRDFAAENILHLRWFSNDGLTGMTPIGQAREAIGLALATEEFGSRYFGNGAQPGIVLEHPGTLSNPAQERMKQNWNSEHQGLSNSHRIAILEEGMKIEKIGLVPEEAQFLETRKFQNLEIARLYRIPPHLLADLDRATFSNIEQMSLEFVAYTIQPWLSRWEQRMNVSLLSEVEQRSMFVEFLLDNLVRGDITARYAAYAIGRQNGWLSADDIREKENLNPLPDGEGKVYLIPMNMMPASDVNNPPALPQRNSATEPEVRDTPIQSASLPSEDDERRAQWMNDRKRLTKTYRRVFQEVAGQVIRRETRDLRDALKKSFGQRSYEGWTAFLDEYYRNIETYLKQKMGPVTETYAELVTQAMERELGIDVTDETTHNFAVSYVSAYINRHVTKSRYKLDKTLDAAQKDGRDAADAVNEELDAWEQDRPDVIANEESVREGNAVAKAIYLLAGVEILRWYTAGAKPCPYCQEMNGKTVSITKYFKSAGDVYQPTDDSEPMQISHDMGHPPLHDGCECLIGRG